MKPPSQAKLPIAAPHLPEQKSARTANRILLLTNILAIMTIVAIVAYFLRLAPVQFYAQITQTPTATVELPTQVPTATSTAADCDPPPNTRTIYRATQPPKGFSWLEFLYNDTFGGGTHFAKFYVEKKYYLIKTTEISPNPRLLVLQLEEKSAPCWLRRAVTRLNEGDVEEICLGSGDTYAEAFISVRCYQFRKVSSGPQLETIIDPTSPTPPALLK